MSFKNTMLFLFFTILIYTVLYYYGIILKNYNSFDENGVIENLQVFVILVSMILFIYYSITERNFKIFFVFGALICFTFILRELDFEKIESLPSSMQFLFGTDGKKYLLPPLWIAFMVGYARNFSLNNLVLKKLIFSKVSIVSAISILFLLLSDLAEKNIFKIKYYQFYEELLELYGYIIMIYLTITVRKVIKRYADEN